MGRKRTRQITAGTGQPARPGGDDSPVTTGSDWQERHTDEEERGRPPRPRAAPEEPGESSRATAGRRVAVVVTGASAVLAVFSSGVLYADLRSGRVTAAASTAQPVSSPVPRIASASPSTVFVQAPSNVPVVSQPVGSMRGAPPVKISIPALKIDQRLVGLRVNANRQLEVPKSFHDIGWWSTGPGAGDQGAAVVVGHLDSPVGPAVFQGLSSLTRGATVAVRRADGTTVKFTVTKVQSFPKERFPDKLVYRTKGRSALHLVTCGGTYTRSTGYRDNVVVFADKVEPKPPAKAKPSTRPTAKASANTKVRATAKPKRRAGTPAKPQPKRESKPRKAVPDKKDARSGD